MSTILKEEEVGVPRICLAMKCRAKTEYFREASLRIDLEQQLARMTRENEIYKDAVNSLLVRVSELLRPDYPALNFVRERLHNMREVAKVLYFLTEDIINIWIVIDEENFEVEMKIARTLRELASVFRNLRFDFMVIPTHETPLESLIPNDTKTLYSRT